MNTDGYPEFTPDDMDWFNDRVCSIVGDPTLISNVGRRRAGLDLELMIAADPHCVEEVLISLDETACRQLADEVAKRTGVSAPVVYVYGYPHPQAQEILDYAARQI